MTSSSTALLFGCAFIAFSPNLALLLILAQKKSQLIIIVTSSAFAFLLSAFCSALLWLPVPYSQRENPILLMPVGVLMQFVFRILFVQMYHRVEDAVTDSIGRHEHQMHGNNNNASSSISPMSETTLLRLELNDWACGIAAGVGFGGMHSLMLYGTLLASQIYDNSKGTLYQDSCSVMPSLVNSALCTFMFSLLDILFMLFAFYGMRKRKISDYENGNFALITTILSHLAASFSTTPNKWIQKDGCYVALPCVFLVLVVTFVIFLFKVAPYYLPADQKRTRITMENSTETTENTAMSYVM